MAHELIRRAFALFDKLQEAEFEKEPSARARVACKKGCFYCCKEPVYASRQEVAVLADRVRAMPAEEQDRIKADLARVVQKMKESGILQHPEEKLAFPYRALNLWCPLLKDGLCSVYEDRPLSCRSHVAADSSKGCEDDALRKDQVFLFAPNTLYPPMEIVLREEDIENENMLLFLHQELNGEEVHSVNHSKLVVENRDEVRQRKASQDPA